jgi:hypothetical protein
MDTQIEKTQGQRLAEKLVEMSADVTSEDRKEATKKFKKNPETIARYLKGQALNPDFSVKLIAYFSERINKRELILMEAQDTHD